jgi:hypothetical protein
MCFKSSLERQDGGGKSSDGGGDGNGGSKNGADSSQRQQSNDRQDDQQHSSGDSTWQGSNPVDTHFKTPTWFPADSLLSSWQDITSKMDPWAASAPDGQSAYCGNLEGYASLSFKVGAQ